MKIQNQKSIFRNQGNWWITCSSGGECIVYYFYCNKSSNVPIGKPYFPQAQLLLLITHKGQVHEYWFCCCVVFYLDYCCSLIVWNGLALHWTAQNAPTHNLTTKNAQDNSKHFLSPIDCGGDTQSMFHQTAQSTPLHQTLKSLPN